MNDENIALIIHFVAVVILLCMIYIINKEMNSED